MFFHSPQVADSLSPFTGGAKSTKILMKIYRSTKQGFMFEVIFSDSATNVHKQSAKSIQTQDYT